MTDVLVVIPTYDEAQNVEAVLRGVRREAPAADVLVVDDGSPDGTADLVEGLGRSLGRIEVLRRSGKSGLGSAYREGFGLGLARGYDVLVEMDADSSHDPAALPLLVDAIAGGADLAIGSRYVPGGSIPSWSASRRALSRWGNTYASWVLGLPANDLTSGYRAFRASALRAVHYADTTATGYAFQVELAHRVFRSGGRITEVPISFHDRTRGESKMSVRITGEALALVSWWAVRDRVARRPRAASVPVAERALA